MTKANYSARDIAQYFLFRGQEDTDLISNLKLQKLLYYAQGLHLVIYNGPLFKEEIWAWRLGPVVRNVYFEYRACGYNGISPDADFTLDSIDEDTRKFLNEIYEVFGQFSAPKLMSLSHSDRCWQDAGRNGIITHKAMREELVKYVKNGKKTS